MDKQNSITGGIFWKFLERIFAQIVSFVVSIVLARILLPDDYGIVSIVLIFITFADVFVNSGFGTSLIQKKDADEMDFNSIFYSSLFVSTIIYFILFLLAPLIANFYKMPLLTNVIRVFGIRIIISSYNTVQHSYVSRKMQFKKFFFSTLFGTILSGFVGIIMALNGFGVWALVAQYLTNTIVDSLILTFTIEWKPKLMFSLKKAKSLMNYGWKVLAADFSGVFFDQLRSLIIGKMYSPADLSYYNKGKQIPTIISDNVSASIMSVLFPAMSNNGENKEEVKKMVKKSTKIITFITLPCLFAVAAMSKPIILILLTSKWENSIIFMQLLSITAAIGIVSGISIQSIKAIGRSDILLKLEFIKKPVYIALLLIGAYYSTLGIAVTGVIYAIYGAIFNCINMGKIIDYNLLEQIKDVIQTVIFSIFLFVILYLINFINISYFAILFIQGILFLLILFIYIKIFKVEEFDFLLEMLKNKMKGKKV